MEILKILVVDDEPGIRSGVSRILSNHSTSYPFMEDDYSYEILEAETGEIALSIIDERLPDIVLLDNKLPGIQGTDVLAYIKEKQLDIVVAMITSYASLEIAIKATGDGATDFIPKPFTPTELKSSIDNITKQLYLRRITRKLKKSAKKVRYQFLSVLSHELKAPINAVEGYLRIMQERQYGNDIDAYGKMIDRSMQRLQGMHNLIMDLLDFTRIRLEKKKEKFKKFNLRKIAKLSVSTIHPYAIQKNITINLHSRDEVIMEGDPEDFEIILNNLISNAVKYNIEDGSVDITLGTKQDDIIIQVTDSGIGMEEEEVSKLFKEFVRIKNEKTKNITGSGLGLSIVKKVVKLYNGNIEVFSKPDKGSTFRITFPRKLQYQQT